MFIVYDRLCIISLILCIISLYFALYHLLRHFIIISPLSIIWKTNTIKIWSIYIFWYNWYYFTENDIILLKYWYNTINYVEFTYMSFWWSHAPAIIHYVYFLIGTQKAGRYMWPPEPSTCLSVGDGGTLFLFC